MKKLGLLSKLGPMMRRRCLDMLLLVPIVSLVLPACQGGDLPNFTVAGRPARWQPTPFASWVPAPLVHAEWIGASSIADTEGQALLDTGSPITVLNPGSEAATDGLTGPFPCKISIMGLLLENPPVIAGNLLASSMDIQGIVGADILSRFCLALDYQAHKAALFDDCSQPPAPPSPTMPWTSLDVALAGGGILHLSDDSKIEVPATRVLLPLVVEGKVLVAVLDTGASSLVLSADLAADLLASDPNRPVLSGLSVTTVDGQTSGWMTRASSVASGEAWLDSVACLVVDSQPLFQGLQAETGADVQALVGETFLRSFAFALDQRNKKLFLARYRSDSHLDPDEFVFVGLALQDGPQGVEVASVYPETDASEKDVRPGDVVTAVDGQSPQDASDAARRILTHEVGQTVELTLLRGTENLTKDLLVENLLPDYPSKPKKARIAGPVRPTSRWWQRQRIGVLGPVLPAGDIGGGMHP